MKFKLRLASDLCLWNDTIHLTLRQDCADDSQFVATNFISYSKSILPDSAIRNC